MPRLNTKGQALMGVGNNIVSVDKVVIDSSAGGGRWQGGKIVYQSEKTGQARIYKSNLVDPPIEISGKGANVLASTPKLVASFLAGNGVNIIPSGPGYPISALGDGSVDSEHLLRIMNYQAGTGIADIITGKEYPYNNINDVRAFFDYFVVRSGNDVFIQNYNSNLPRRVETLAPGTSSVEFQGKIYMLYNYGDYLVFHESTSLLGRVITSNGHSYNPDAIVTEDGKLIIAYSLGQAELPQELVVLDQDAILSLPVVNLRTLGESIVPGTVTPFNRKIWAASFFEEGKYGKTPFIGNATINVENNDIPHVNIASKDAPVTNLTIARWSSGSNFNTLQAEYEQVIDSDMPTVAYIDDGRIGAFPHTLPVWINPNKTWFGLQLYRDKFESVESFKTRCFNLLRFVVTNYRIPVCIVVQAYDRNGTVTEDHILGALSIIPELVNKYPEIVGIFPFAALRPGGYVFYPKVHGYVKEIMNACNIRPTRKDFWVDVNTPNPPTQPFDKEKLRDKIDAGEIGPLTAEEKAYLIALIEDTDMNEQDVEAIESYILNSPHVDLLGKGNDEIERKYNAYLFCAKNVADLRNKGYDVGLLFKDSGNNVNKRSTDIICIRFNQNLVHHYDVVVGNESPDAHVTFEDIGLVDPERFRES